MLCILFKKFKKFDHPIKKFGPQNYVRKGHNDRNRILKIWKPIYELIFKHASGSNHSFIVFLHEMNCVRKWFIFIIIIRNLHWKPQYRISMTDAFLQLTFFHMPLNICKNICWMIWTVEELASQILRKSTGC